MSFGDVLQKSFLKKSLLNEIADLIVNDLIVCFKPATLLKRDQLKRLGTSGLPNWGTYLNTQKNIFNKIIDKADKDDQ